MGPCSRSVLITFTVRVTKQHPVNISFLKKLVQRTRALIHTHRTRTHILFCDKTRVPMFYFLNKHYQ